MATTAHTLHIDPLVALRYRPIAQIVQTRVTYTEQTQTSHDGDLASYIPNFNHRIISDSK